MPPPVKHSFTPEQVSDYKEVFDSFDADGSGSIEAKELKSVLQKLGTDVPDQAIQEMLTEYDTDKSGTLEFEEFLSMLFRLQSGPSEKDVRAELFTMFDDDLDGLVTLEELRSLFKRAVGESGGTIEMPTDDMLDRMIKAADRDGDGKLSNEEFFAVVDLVSASQ